MAEAVDGVASRGPPACVVVETEYSRAAHRLEEIVWEAFPEGGITFNTAAAAGDGAGRGPAAPVPAVDARLLPPSDPVTGQIIDRWVPLDRESGASGEEGARTWHWLRSAHSPRAPRPSSFEVTAHCPGWGPPLMLHSKLASGRFPSLTPRPGLPMAPFAARALLAVARVHAQQLARMCDRSRPVGAPSEALFQALARGREESVRRGDASPLARWGQRRFEEETSGTAPAPGMGSASDGPAAGAPREAAGFTVRREGAGEMWSPHAVSAGSGSGARQRPPGSSGREPWASEADGEAEGSRKAASLDPWERVPFFAAAGALDRTVALWGAQAPPEEVRTPPPRVGRGGASSHARVPSPPPFPQAARWRAHLWDSLCYEARVQRALPLQRAAAATVSWIDVLLLLLQGEVSPLARGVTGLGPCPLEVAAHTLQLTRQARERRRRRRGRAAPVSDRASAVPWLRIPRTRAGGAGGEAVQSRGGRPDAAQSPRLPSAEAGEAADGAERGGQVSVSSPRVEAEGAAVRARPLGPAPCRVGESVWLRFPGQESASAVRGVVEAAAPRRPGNRGAKARGAGEVEVQLRGARTLRAVPTGEAGVVEAVGPLPRRGEGGAAATAPAPGTAAQRERKPLPAAGFRSAVRVGDRLSLGGGGGVRPPPVRSGAPRPKA